MFFLFYGFLVWLGATIIFRSIGQFFFTLDQPFFLIATYLLVVPLIFVVTYLIYRWKRVNALQQVKAAILIALPGLLIDSIVLVFFSTIFVNLEPAMDRIFGSWLLWAYSLV